MFHVKQAAAMLRPSPSFVLVAPVSLLLFAAGGPSRPAAMRARTRRPPPRLGAGEPPRPENKAEDAGPGGACPRTHGRDSGACPRTPEKNAGIFHTMNVAAPLAADRPPRRLRLPPAIRRGGVAFLAGLAIVPAADALGRLAFPLARTLIGG